MFVSDVLNLCFVCGSGNNGSKYSFFLEDCTFLEMVLDVVDRLTILLNDGISYSPILLLYVTSRPEFS